jgi:hypothetical protein
LNEGKIGTGRKVLLIFIGINSRSRPVFAGQGENKQLSLSFLLIEKKTKDLHRGKQDGRGIDSPGNFLFSHNCIILSKLFVIFSEQNKNLF